MASKQATYDALLGEIERQVGALENSGLNKPTQARVLSDLALAYRYTSGGSQPGSVTVEK